jgi:hypothetical protein
MPQEKRIAVNLTEAEISALVITVSSVRVGDVHICRVKQLHEALEELRNAKREVEIARGE